VNLPGEALGKLRAGIAGRSLRVLTLVPKDEGCEHPGKACHGDACPLARGFYDRLPAARDEAVGLGWLDAAAQRQVALRHGLCPYCLGQELVRWAFLKDWERLSRSGRYDLKRLKEVMLLLIANDSPLGPEWLDALALVLQRLERSLQVLESARLASRQPLAIQFSVSNPGTRSNSPRLLVTSVSPSLRAWAAMCRSFTPIGRPTLSSALRMAP
jgi:hypothetical protein